MTAPRTGVTLTEAQNLVRERLRTLAPQTIPLDEALGRTLAANVVADRDAPPFAKALMDGYAVRSADVLRPPATLRIAGQIAAGQAPTEPVEPGTAIQINTGAPMPSGADAVVRVEDTALAGEGQVRVEVTAEPGSHVCSRGAYATAGDVVLQRGQPLTPIEVAVASAAGATTLEVYDRPGVALLVTGDELIDASEQPQGAQIRDSNGPALRAAIHARGADVVDLGRVGDDRVRLRRLIGMGLEADCLCVTGGISMGAFDFVPEILGECGVEIVFRKMATKPGRPTLYGLTDAGTHVFALPGNPVSAMIGWWMLVEPALRVLSGEAWSPPVRLAATLEGAVGAGGGRESFRPAKVRVDEDGRLRASVLSWGGSGDPFGMAGANALVVREPRAEAVADGGQIFVMPLRRW